MVNKGLDLITGYEYDQYDDEYDDTYDSQNVGIIDHDSSEYLLVPVKRYEESAYCNSTNVVFRLNEKGLYSSQRWTADNEDKEDTSKQPVTVGPTDPVRLLERPLTPDKVKKEVVNEERVEPKGKRKGKGKKKITGESKDDVTDRKAKVEPRPSNERQRAYKERHKGSYGNHNRQKLSGMKRGGFH